METLNELRSEARVFADVIGRTVADSESRLRARLSVHPYAVLGAATGLGFVLGRLMGARTLATMGALAGRAIVAAFVGEAIKSRAAAFQEE